MKDICRSLAMIVLHYCIFTLLTYGQGTTITLLHVNDTHSHLDAFGPKTTNLEGTLGGIAKAAMVIGQIRATEEHVLLLHAGDVFQGDPMFNTYFGVPEFQLMKEIGFDAMAVGNHEFDFGPGVLNDVLSTAFAGGSFPLISANLDMSAFPALQTWIQPSVMKTIGGVKIGIFGLTLPNSPMNMPAPVIIRDDLVAIAQNTVDSLKAHGADVVICLSHLGVFYDKSVFASVSGLAFVIGGHDHSLFSQPLYIADRDGKRVPIVQAGAHYKYVGELRFTAEDGEVTMNDYRVINVDDAVPAEPSVQAIVESLKPGVVSRYGDLYGTVIGTASSQLSESFDQGIPLRDTPLGNLVTDAFREKTGTDIAITALGLISEPIYKGKIVGADVFRAMSYGYDEATGLGFQMATFDISGFELVKGLEIGLSQLEVGDDVFLQVSGMRFSYDAKQSVGQRVILNSLHVDQKRFSPLTMYSVTVNTGILALLSMLGVSVSNVEVMPDFEYHVVRNFIARHRSVNFQSQGRIREIQSSRSMAMLSSDARTVGEHNSLRALENYPNPFNPATSLRYELLNESHVRLKIYSVLGQEVAQLVDEFKSPGNYAVTWNATDVPSGVYYARLEAAGSTMTKRLLLLK